MRALIGLGGNLGGGARVARRFQLVVRALHARPATRRVTLSSVRSTLPVGPVAKQPVFANAALLLDSDQPAGGAGALALLGELLALELTFGRDRAHEHPQGPRTLDLDLLACDDLVCDVAGPPRLILPHPRLSRRAFVLEPLIELLGDGAIVAGTGATLGALLAAAR